MARLLNVIIAVALMAMLSPFTLTAQTPKKIRLGVYDSRAVFVAWFNSPLASSPMPALQKRMQTAQERKDEKEIASCHREALLRQAMTHEQGFGTGSIRAIMTKLEKEIAAVVAEEKLDCVVSKWEVNYAGNTIETVDITAKLVAAIRPNDKMKNIAAEMEKHPPVEDAYLIDD